MVRVLRRLDDALSEIRESLLVLSRSRPLLIKIVNESGQHELNVFKIDREDVDQPVEEHRAEAQPRQRVVIEPSRPMSDHVQRLLRAQHEHILELESTLASTREELRRVLERGESPRACALADAAGRPSPAASSVTDGVSDDEASVADTGVSVLLLTDTSSTNIADGNDSGDEAAATTSDSDVSDASSTGSSQVAGESTSRRSDRQRKPVDRLVSSAQPMETSSGAKRKSASAFETATSSTSKTKKIKQTGRTEDSNSAINNRSNSYGEEVEDGEEELEIAALTTKLKEAYDRRATVAMDSTSRSAVQQLVLQVLAHPQADTATTNERHPALQQWATHIASLITTSSAQKMLGYYLRSVLAHHLKHSSRQYSRLARDVLGIKSPNDIATYPAFFDLVQQHCPAIAAATTTGIVTEATVEQWLREPLFIADIGWSEWRKYLSKLYRHITEAAVQRFLTSIEPFQDWMQQGWAEIYDDEKLGGQGVRALRDIHMPTSKARQAQRDVAASISAVAADLHCASSECVRVKDATLDADRVCLIQLDRQRVFDARHHWIGKINHLPMPHCNLRLTSSGKLVQIKPIAAGDALTFDYDVDYWVYQLSGLELSGWLVSSSIASNRGTQDLFKRMHDSVHDYTALLRCDWVKRRPAVWSELERELWMAHLAEYLDERGF